MTAVGQDSILRFQVAEFEAAHSGPDHRLVDEREYQQHVGTAVDECDLTAYQIAQPRLQQAIADWLGENAELKAGGDLAWALHLSAARKARLSRGRSSDPKVRPQPLSWAELRPPRAELRREPHRRAAHGPTWFYLATGAVCAAALALGAVIAWLASKAG
jgi:hypothetical protein